MARPIWNGTISFGLLNVPVRLYPGERSVDVQFRMLGSRDNKPVRYERVNSETGEEVPWKEIVKGFEYSVAARRARRRGRLLPSARVRRDARCRSQFDECSKLQGRVALIGGGDSGKGAAPGTRAAITRRPGRRGKPA